MLFFLSHIQPACYKNGGIKSGSSFKTTDKQAAELSKTVLFGQNKYMAMYEVVIHV